MSTAAAGWLVAERRAAVAAFNGVPAADVPADAVTASASGLDPGISVAYADL
jgi:K+-transporting ATPase ATPase C chain